MLVALYEPEIPPNTGNIARLCAAFGVSLHLIEPLGFSLENRYLKRAGLDYWPHVRLSVWRNFSEFHASLDGRLVMFTTRASLTLPDFHFSESDALLFGPETRGLPDDALAISPYHVKIPILPMAAGGARSLNLSSACAIALYTGLANCNLLP